MIIDCRCGNHIYADDIARALDRCIRDHNAAWMASRDEDRVDRIATADGRLAGAASLAAAALRRECITCLLRREAQERKERAA